MTYYTSQMPLRRVAVFCEPRPDAGPEHRELAASAGKLLAENAITVMYDGSAEGARGALADAVLAAGGRVVGVVAEAKADRPPPHPGLTEVQLVPDVAAQHDALADLADGFLALPGGLGSLEQLFAIWSWGQLGYHEKPCGLLNLQDYYTALLRTGDDSLFERFVRETQRGMLIVDRDPAALLKAMADFRPPETRRQNFLDES